MRQGWLKSALYFCVTAVCVPPAYALRAEESVDETTVAVDRFDEAVTTSPDGRTYLRVFLRDGRLFYRAGYYGGQQEEVTLVEDSPLGLHTNIGDFADGLQWKGIARDTLATTYELSRSKVSRVDYRAHVLTVNLTNRDGLSMMTEFRVSDANIAFRYRIPMQGETACMVVDSEVSGFDFPSGTTTFICPQSTEMIGWKRTKPSYEEEYTPDEPMGTPSKYGCGYTFPCLFRVGGDGWVLVSETGVGGNYCASHLSEGTVDGLYTVAYPMPGENNGFGSTGAQVGLPGATPWRTITLAPTLAPVVETTVPFDVVEPLYEPSQAYKPGRSTWSWILWQDNSLNYEDQCTYIRLAADLGWEYCLVDGLWQKGIGRERMGELFRLAKQLGVELFVWYNSNGGWNDAPQDPKNCMSNPIARKAEMKWLRDNGAKGIKVDFFAGDKQETLRLYEAILSDANDYGLQVIFHGCTLPRGWERMYPNYCASEAVLASENLVFQQHFCDFEAFNACLHPFIRNAVGSMDFGGTVLNGRLNRGNDGGTVRRTTDVFELATAVVFQSSVQNFALAPNNLTEQPGFEIDFMKTVPTAWDEIRFLDGYPGRYVALARRSGADWYVAVLNAEPESRTLTLQLPMLAGKTVTYYHDGKDGRTPQCETVKVNRNGRFRLTVPTNGGAVIRCTE
ncbi:MAG: glycoside hydrolase family 97 protein [Clostridium sp.]|nr:glycoside hydrolase family 97 protein [Clostridium sp.]